MKGALAIFAKTQGLSPVKTRLAKSVGTETAENFYAHSVKAVTEVVQNAQKNCDHQLIPHWALAENQAVQLQQWQSFNAMWTGEGGLGERLHHIYHTLNDSCDYVMMMGTDSPHVKPEAILQAIDKLADHPDSCVIGPCPDGGFYLFVAQINIPEQVWTNVTYSKNTTLNELTQQLSSHGINIELLSPLGDVDTIEDLAPLYQSLKANSNALPAQQILYHWLQKIM